MNTKNYRNNKYKDSLINYFLSHNHKNRKCLITLSNFKQYSKKMPSKRWAPICGPMVRARLDLRLYADSPVVFKANWLKRHLVRGPIASWSARLDTGLRAGHAE